MSKRKVTQAVIDANRANARKSTGPRTAAGKVISKRNARTHGFFSRELLLNEEERHELAAICTRLHAELSPNTVMQSIGFEEIAANLGRCKKALRLEMRYVDRAFARDDHNPQSDQSYRPNAQTEWYLAGKQGLRQGLQVLHQLKQEFEDLGRIDPKWNDVLDSAFGLRFRQALTRWDTRDREAALLAQFLKSHEKTYNMPLPPMESGKPEVCLDPFQTQQMVTHLIEIEESMLSDLWQSCERRALDSAREQNGTVEFAPRYFSSACRDLHRSIDRYMELKKNNP
jgi:hypothetical protein